LNCDYEYTKAFSLYLPVTKVFAIDTQTSLSSYCSIIESYRSSSDRYI